MTTPDEGTTDQFQAFGESVELSENVLPTPEQTVPLTAAIADVGAVVV